MEDYKGKVRGSIVKRLKKSKSLEFVGWGSKNLIEFLESLGRDTTNKISEYDVTEIVRKYIREQNLSAHPPSMKKKKTKTIACDNRLRLLFESQRINIIKVPDLVAKHYAENQDDIDSYYCLPEGDQQQRLSPSDKAAKQTKQVLQKPKGTFAAIVSDNIKLLYLRKSFVQELAKTPETFESRVMGTFVRIKNPCQLVQVTGVKERNPIHGYLLQVTNYTYHLKDALFSVLSDDDFSQEECEELHQRIIKNGFVKRLTVVDVEEKIRSLHEDVTKHWIARELVLLQRLIDRANEKGWRRELSQYLEKRELLNNPEEQLRLLREVPEVVAEELEPECVDDDGNIENDLMEPNPEASIEARQSDEEQQPSDSPVSSVQETREIFKLCDGEEQPTWTASAGDKDLHEDVEEQRANGIIAQNKDSISEEVEMIGVNDEPQAQPNAVEMIELSDDDEDNNNGDDQHYDPKKVVWLYEFPKGQTQGPFSMTDLKKWSDDEYFVEIPDFKVWMRGERRESAVSLTKLLPRIKT